MDGVATVAARVAEKVAPHVKKHGSKLVPESLKTGGEGRASSLEGAKVVAASSLHGIPAETQQAPAALRGGGVGFPQSYVQISAFFI